MEQAPSVDHTHRRRGEENRERGNRELEEETERALRVVLSREDNAISVSLGVSGEDLTVNKI